MVPYFLNDLGFTLELRSPSNFKTTGLIQPWQTLGKMFARCLTIRATGHDQPPLTTLFTRTSININSLSKIYKLIVGHYMTAYAKISRRVPNKYHNLKHNEMVKSIFNSRKNKAGVGMKIPSWMITDEIKLMKNYRMYAEVFGVDGPTTHP
ncbi:hypothetical protein Tco_0339274 [Tanacetum coccineum]